jgi:colanic acid/amylovoran biosynthesis protein
MRKIFLDIYLANNFGDDLFLDILLSRYPNTIFYINYHGVQYDKFFSRYKNLKKTNYNIFYKILRRIGIYNRLKDYNFFSNQYDALLFLGGGIFREESYADKLIIDRDLLTFAFNSKSKKIFFLSCNFGPYKSQLFINKYTEIFKRADDICFRDINSYNLFRNLKISRVYPDIVFSYDFNILAKDSNLCGISLINPNHKEGSDINYSNYVKMHVDLVNSLLDNNLNVIFYSFCEKEGDVEIYLEILDKINHPRKSNIDHIVYHNDPYCFIEKLSLCKYMIASRFHAIVFGLLNNVILLPFVYNVKNKNLLIDINFRNLILDYNSKDQLDLNLIFENYIFPDMSNYKINSEKQFLILDEYIDKH